MENTGNVRELMLYLIGNDGDIGFPYGSAGLAGDDRDRFLGNAHSLGLHVLSRHPEAQSGDVSLGLSG